MYNIVVFDDDIKQCEIIKKMIEKCDITVRQILTVASREELGQMLDYGYRIDILVADIFLEGDTKNGIDVVKEVLLNGFGTQIIYITGFIEYCEDVYETEHVYFLKKPVEPVRLNKALKEAVKQIEEYNNKAIMIQNGSIFTKIRTQVILENDMNVIVSRNFYGQVKDRLIHFMSGI